jgi:hypothetical protein
VFIAMHIKSNKAFITYTHRDADVMSDKFTYACRVDDGPVSAPATVSLIGQVLEPKLEIIDAPRIGKVFLGGEESGVRQKTRTSSHLALKRFISSLLQAPR